MTPTIIAMYPRTAIHKDYQANGNDILNISLKVVTQKSQNDFVLGRRIFLSCPTHKSLVIIEINAVNIYLV